MQRLPFEETRDMFGGNLVDRRVIPCSRYPVMPDKRIPDARGHKDEQDKLKNDCAFHVESFLRAGLAVCVEKNPVEC